MLGVRRLGSFRAVGASATGGRGCWDWVRFAWQGHPPPADRARTEIGFVLQDWAFQERELGSFRIFWFVVGPPRSACGG